MGREQRTKAWESSRNASAPSQNHQRTWTSTRLRHRFPSWWTGLEHGVNHEDSQPLRTDTSAHRMLPCLGPASVLTWLPGQIGWKANWHCLVYEKLWFPTPVRNPQAPEPCTFPEKYSSLTPWSNNAFDFPPSPHPVARTQSGPPKESLCQEKLPIQKIISESCCVLRILHMFS